LEFGLLSKIAVPQATRFLKHLKDALGVVVAHLDEINQA
jgi:hypothetical protein